MRKPKAQTITPRSKNNPRSENNPRSKSKTRTASRPGTEKTRVPKAFIPENAVVETLPPDNWNTDQNPPEITISTNTKRPNWALRLVLWAGGLLISLGLALAADQLIANLFTRYQWLGWLGTVLFGLFISALLIMGLREFLALRSLKNLDNVRIKAANAVISNRPDEGHAVLGLLNQLYHNRPDLARARAKVERDIADQLDGADMIHIAERTLMGKLDAHAKSLTAASARRVALVTAISPRALVDIAFVAYESMKLARAIATLYGARPGFFGSWRLAGAILSHLAVTGGVALGDSVIQQLLGHGLAAKLSARLGEGLVNGLMSVRVGIAAMRVTRPLPYDRLKQPQVMDFMADLAKITRNDKTDSTSS